MKTNIAGKSLNLINYDLRDECQMQNQIIETRFTENITCFNKL